MSARRTLKCLTIQQPHAHGVIYGGKSVENRPWFTNYRGELGIHAGKGLAWLDDDACAFYARFIRGFPPTAAAARRVLHFGYVIGIVEVVGCVRPSMIPSNPFAIPESPWCHQLANARAIPPFPAVGKQGYFEVEIPDPVPSLFQEASSR